MNAEYEDLPNTPEPTKKFNSVIEEMLSKIHKPEHLQNILLTVRTELLHERAYMRYKFGSDNADAIAASAYSLAKLHLIDLIINSGTTHELPI